MMCMLFFVKLFLFLKYIIATKMEVIKLKLCLVLVLLVYYYFYQSLCLNFLLHFN